MIDEPFSSIPSPQQPESGPLSPPSIDGDGWGEIFVKSEGKRIQFRDVVLLPERALPWDWKWSGDGGMDHSPGVRENDLDHYILSCAPLPHTVILSTGRSGVLQVDPKRKQYLLSRGIKEVYILETAEAIEKYRELCAQGLRVAALIHTTC
jgi:hypothetical protein